jgi:hypothetical protein
MVTIIFFIFLATKAYMLWRLSLFYFGDFGVFFVSHLSAIVFFKKGENKNAKKKYDNNKKMR